MIRENVYEKLYRSKDLPSCAFLIAKDKVLESIERDGPVCWFVFQDEESCKKLTNDFWFNDGSVSAKKYYEAVQTLKNQIYSNK